MKIIYAPENGAAREFLFKPRQILSFDSELIEEVGGPVWLNWDGFRSALAAGKGRALRAVLWHELRKEKPDLAFADVTVHAGEINAYYDDEEIANARAVAADPETPESVREGIWVALGKGATEDSSVTSDSDTDSSSPDMGSAA